MKAKCINVVNKLAGRKLSEAEIRKIDDRIRATMRRLARQDHAGWASKSIDTRVMEAAAQAMADMEHEAALKVKRAQLQVLKTAATDERVLADQYGKGRNNALINEMENTRNYIEGIKRENLSNMMALIDAVKSKNGATAGRKALMAVFDAENPAMTRDLAVEIFNKADGSTGNQLAKDAARAWLDVIESSRERFNDAGGDIGKLDYGYIPQPHDQVLVRGKGNEAAREKWTDTVIGLLDRTRYVQEDGSLMTDVQVRAMLKDVWETISTGGINKIEPGTYTGRGMRANSGSMSREIHFRDANAYLDYMSKYGSGTMYDAMISHVGRVSRDIGLVERYGPNPQLQMRLQLDIAKKTDVGEKRTFGLTPQSYWDVLSGQAGMAENGNIAWVAQHIRNIQTFGKLGGAVISSFTDLGTFFVTVGYNKLPYFEAMKNVGKQFDSDTRSFLTSHGVIAETMISDLNRWSGDNIKHNWSGSLANSTMKLSFLNAWTDTLRRGFSMTMMAGLARLSKTDWGNLTEWDRTHLIRKGITEADWNVI